MRAAPYFAPESLGGGGNEPGTGEGEEEGGVGNEKGNGMRPAAQGSMTRICSSQV